MIYIMKKKFNISYNNGTPMLRSAIVEAESISKALVEFADVSQVVGIVEIDSSPNLKPITMLADKDNMTLLRSGRTERIINISETHIETETGKYSRVCVKLK